MLFLGLPILMELMFAQYATVSAKWAKLDDSCTTPLTQDGKLQQARGSHGRASRVGYISEIPKVERQKPPLHAGGDPTLGERA